MIGGGADGPRNSALRFQIRRPMLFTVVRWIRREMPIWRIYLTSMTVDKAVEYILAQPDGKIMPTNPANASN